MAIVQVMLVIDFVSCCDMLVIIFRPLRKPDLISAVGRKLKLYPVGLTTIAALWNF